MLVRSASAHRLSETPQSWFDCAECGAVSAADVDEMPVPRYIRNKFCCTCGQETRATAECCIFCNKHWVCCDRKCNGKPCTPPSNWSAATVAELGKDNKQLARQATATIDNAIVAVAKARQQAAQEAEAEADFADFLAEVESGYPGGGEARHGPSTLSQSSRLQ